MDASTLKAENEAIWERVRDDIPESFWKVATWLPDGNWASGSLDVADRRRIGMAITQQVNRRVRLLPDKTTPEEA